MFDEMKLPQLRKACRERGLPVSGKKDELIERLNAFEANPVPDPAADAPDPAADAPDPAADAPDPAADAPDPAADAPDPAPKAKPKANEPDPDNPNWDRAGRWIRRGKDYKSDEEKAAEEKAAKE